MGPIEKIDVYYNLHKRVWSCKSRKTGRVIRHARVVISPYDSTMVVLESGRQRVIAEGRKNVHAFARIDSGQTSDDVDSWIETVEAMDGLTLVSYNPYRAGHFYRKDTGAPVTMVSALIMLAKEGQPPVVWAVEKV